MRLLKWLLIGLFALVIAVLVAGYVALSNFPVEDLKAMIEKQAEAATGRKLEIAGDVKMHVSLTPAIVMEDVSLANAPWAGREPMARIKRLEVELSLLPLLSNEIAIERLAVIEPVLDLETNAEGQSNWQVASGGPLKRADETLPSFKEITVEKGVVDFKPAPGLPAQRIAIESLSAGAAGLDEALSGEMKGSLERGDFDLFFQLGSMRQMLTEESFPFFLQGHLDDTDLNIDGGIAGRNALHFALSLKAKSLDKLAPLVGQPLPAVGPLDLEVKVKAGHEAVELNDLSLRLADSDLAGRLTLALTGERPKASGGLTAKKLAPGQLLVGPWAVLPATTGRQPLVPDVALPLSLMELADLDLDLDVAEFALPDGSELGGLKTKVVLEDRDLTFSPLSFTLAGGRFDGTLRLNRRQTPARFELESNVKGLDYGPLLALPLRGHLDASVDLKGEGEDLRSMVSSMRGRSRATSSDTVVRQAMLAMMGNGLLQIFSPLFGGSDEVKLTCVISDLMWYGGTARSEASAIAGDNFVSTISGTTDILKERLDLYVDTKGRGVSLSSLVVPVRVTGPIDNPTVLPDPTGTVLSAAEAAGMVLFPPLLAGDLLDIELRKASNPAEACLAAVKTIEASGGTSSLVARWAQKGGAAASNLLENATDAAESIGEAVGSGVGAVGGAVGQGLEDAVGGVKSLFGN